MEQKLIDTLSHLGLLNYFISSFLIFIVGISFVYILGRMFELVNSNRGRNFIALITISAASYFRTCITFRQTNQLEFYYNMLIIFSGAIVLYVLIGFTLFDRVDHFLDKRFAKDSTRKKNK